MGFIYVASGPLVRSSYRAGDFFAQKIFQNLPASKFSLNGILIRENVRELCLHPNTDVRMVFLGSSKCPTKFFYYSVFLLNAGCVNCGKDTFLERIKWKSLTRIWKCTRLL